jgi:hypothetical protein
MEILGLTFVGTSTPQRTEMGAFLSDHLGLEPSSIDGIDVDAFRLPDGSTFVVTSPGERGESRRTVGLRVSDVDRAHRELREAGLASGPEPAANSRFRYSRFRAPDGCLYELVEELPRAGRPASPLELVPLGVVRSARSDLSDDGWARERSTIELDPRQLEPSAVAGLEEFSHIEVVFQFHRVAAGGVERGARHPRGREDLPSTSSRTSRGSSRGERPASPPGPRT